MNELNDMDCEHARTILIPADEPRIADADVLRALAHAESCPSCRLWIDQDREIAERIRRAAPRLRAPRAVRERVYEAIARERAGSGPEPSRRSGRWRWGLWAALPALAAVVLWMLGPARARNSGTVFVQDYLRKAVEAEMIHSSNLDTISAFLIRELGASIRPPTVPGAELSSAEICLLDGQRGALLTYEMGGRPLSYYIVRKRGRLAALTSAKPTAHLISEGALKVVLWSDDGFAYAVVGEHPTDYLLTFAHAAGGY